MGRPPVAAKLDEAALQRILPLPPDASGEVPIMVRIGEGRTDAPGTFKVLVTLEYLGAEEEATRPDPPAQDAEGGEGGEGPGEQGKGEAGGVDGEGTKGQSETKEPSSIRLGRVLELPVSLTVHKMLRVAKCTFFRGDFLLPKVCLALVCFWKLSLPSSRRIALSP
jgi:hypothetical protein